MTGKDLKNGDKYVHYAKVTSKNFADERSQELKVIADRFEQMATINSFSYGDNMRCSARHKDETT